MITVSTGHFVILCFAGLLCWALVSDALTMKIPNRISIGIVALYPAWVLATWPRVEQPLIPVALACGVLAAGFFAFDRGWIGGGDAKMLAALSLWSGVELFLPMLFVTTLAGGVMATSAICSEAMRRRTVLARGGEVAGPFLSSVVKSKIPYGVAIAIGGGVVAVGLWTG